MPPPANGDIGTGRQAQGNREVTTNTGGAEHPLSPNLERAWELLHEAGPQRVEELREQLRAQRIVLSPERLAALPERHPDRFAGTPDGRLEAIAPHRDAPVDHVDEDQPDSELAWLALPRLASIAHSDVVVVDIETTGLNRATDRIWEIAAVTLSGDRSMCRRVLLDEPPEDLPEIGDSESDGPAVPLAEALGDLAAFLHGAKAVAGQNLADFDLPFLAAEATRADVAWSTPDAVIDLIELSVLVRPGLASRRLADLCRELGVDLVDAHRALADATATAEAIRRLLVEIEVDDPSWALAASCLIAGNHPLSALLPEFPRPSSIEAGLQPAHDPLCDPVADRHWTSAREAAHIGLTELEAGDDHRRRPAQHEMADAVGQAQDAGGRLAVEAPTGTGKSLAYLLPSAGRAAAGRPVVLATATKVLQQQLREDALMLRDRNLLTVPFRQIQGVSNYVCTREIAEWLTDPPAADDTSAWTALAVAVRALHTIPTGTWSDATDGAVQWRNPRYRLVRHTLRTDVHGCERRQCPWVSSCPLFHRLRGLDAAPGVLSVNHALVASWVAALSNGQGTRVESGGSVDAGDADSPNGPDPDRELRAPADVLARGDADLVFDEAHELEDTFTGAWTETLSEFDLSAMVGSLGGRRGPIRLARDATRALGHPSEVREAVKALRRATDGLRKETDRLGDAVRTYVHEYGGRGGEAVLQAGITERRPEFRQAVRPASVGLRITLLEVRRSASTLIEALRSAAQTSPSRPPSVGAALSRLFAVVRQLDGPIELAQSLRDVEDPHLWVHRLTVDRRDEVGEGGSAPAAAPWSYERLPIYIGERFQREVVAPAHSVVLTSATLRTGGTFDFIGQRLGVTVEPGVDDPELFQGLVLASPFDHARQSALVLTNHLPVPVPAAEQEFCEELAADQVGFLSLSGGKALVLFAARARMQTVADLTRERQVELEARGVRIITQDEVSRVELAARFREDPGTVAFGLRSYWQGFDAKGETLTYLVIEKPPYPHPGDALASARQRAIEDVGGDPFLEYVVPRTAVLLAQGFGRLIRDEDDRGVAIMCDRRLQSPSRANQILLESLPGPVIHYADGRDDAWAFAIRFATGVEPDLSDALALPLDDVSNLLQDLRLIPGEDPEPKLRQAALALFGIEELRDEQLQLMVAFLEGRDALGVMPTGSGKSLCFQLPALLAPEDRATVVVSPLVALIKDQVDELRGRRGLRPVQGITGRTSGTVRTEILRDVADGRVRLLYVSPERLTRDLYLVEALARQQLQGLVVDEAHCISVWGHDFRPEFRQIPNALHSFKRSPRLGLTATATPQVADDVSASLDLDDPLVVRAPADRHNLRYWALELPDERSRARRLLRIVLSMGDRPGIVYTHRRATTEEVAALLRAAGVPARHYHAGLVPEQREAIQDDFFADNTRVIVATKAFGMGINKPDIGWIVHYDLPESLDSYAQEAGRAARDPDLVGECVLLFTKQDIARRYRLADRSSATASTQLALRLLTAVQGERCRGASVVFDPEVMADRLGVDEDELNVALAWMERLDVVERELDCSLRGMVSRGVREPEDIEDRRRFTELFTIAIRLTPDKSSQVDFNKLEDERGLDPDVLERDLVRWSLDRLISFSSTRRAWRVRLTGVPLDAREYARRIEEFQDWGRTRLTRMIGYARTQRCRRVELATHFGDPVAPCAADPSVLACDICSGARPPWDDLPDHEVPDPETIVDVEVVILKAVAWASRFAKGRYGAMGLKLALLGSEQYGDGRPIGAGLLGCPQFGALRYVRAGDRRFEEAVASAIANGLIAREQAEHPGGRTYEALTLTDRGRAAVGAVHG